MSVLRQLLFLTMIAMGLCACDGGSVVPLADTSMSSPPTRISGRATKGPLDGATIEFFVTDDRGRPVGAAVSSAITDANGNWSATVPADHTGLLVRSVGGRFVDESDPNDVDPRTVTLSDSDALLSFLPAGETVTAITLVTNALVRKAQLEADAANFVQRLVSNRVLYTAALGLDPLATTAADPLAPVGNDDERRYALIAGGLAYSLNALAIERGLAVADFATIDLLLADLIDCQLDGLGLGGQVLYDIAALDGRSLNDEILRFRNNHFDDYADLGAPLIDNAGCAPTPGANDVVAPQFSAQAPALTLAAEDATGVAPGSAVNVAAAAFVATDDRDAQPRIDVSLPERLPLGPSIVTVVATDGWGNATQVGWQINVTDQTPPQITAPANVSAAASDVLTSVALGTATASDNVSGAPLLTITNDAPQGGFVVGDTVVTWQVVDAAGLRATAEQIVTVVGQTPQLSAAVAPVLATPGSAIDLDLSVYFSDPFDATLSYTLIGLPPGTGLTFDAQTGILSGEPSAADLAASPLTLEVVASNGQFDLSTSFSLSIAPTVPAFALSQIALTLAEDFTQAAPVVAVLDVPTPPDATVFAVTVSDPIVEVDIADDGQLAITAVADANGVVTVTVSATNVINDEVFSRALTLTITPVNDVPQALLDDEALEIESDSTVALSLLTRFTDVDDAQLSYAALSLPRSLQVDADGVVRGVPQEDEAASGVFAVTITATDAAGAVATTQWALQVVVSDRDGDGVSDARELALGTNPDLVDSDADGVDDGTEVRAGADPLLPAANVFYVSTSGDNANDGLSFATAWRDQAGLMNLPAGLSAAQPTYVLYESDLTQTYGGMLWMMMPCDHIVFAGSVSRTTGARTLDESNAPTTTLTSLQSPSFEIDGCNNVQVHSLQIVDNTRHAVVTESSDVRIVDVHVRNNRTVASGGALSFTDGAASLDNVFASANDSDSDGGAIAVLGSQGSFDFSNLILMGNRATGAGGALYIDSAGATVTVNNALITTNAANRGAAVFVAAATETQVQNVTATLNQTTGTTLGPALDAETGAPLALRDSVLIGNVDAQRLAAPLTDTADSDFNSMDRTPVGANDAFVPPGVAAFAEQYFLTTAAQAVDNGSVSAVVAQLDTRFAAAASFYADEGQVDRGFHFLQRPTALPTPTTLRGSLSVDTSAGTRIQGYVALDVTPRVNGVALGSGHRVTLEPLDGRSDLVNVVRVFDPLMRRDVLATDLGDGRYRVYLDGRPPAAKQFTLRVDDIESDSVLRVVCPLGGCAGNAGSLQAP